VSEEALAHWGAAVPKTKKLFKPGGVAISISKFIFYPTVNTRIRCKIQSLVVYGNRLNATQLGE